jgi:hypothetical protein
MKRLVALSLVLYGLAMVLWGVSFALASSVVVGSGGADKLFAPGANLCKLVSTAKMDAAVGVKFPVPVWQGGACFWQTGKLGQLNRTIVRLSLRPGLGKSNVTSIVTLDKKAKAKVSTVSLPGASYAVVSALPPISGLDNESLYAVFPKGLVVLSLTGPKLTVAKAVAAGKVAVA